MTGDQRELAKRVLIEILHAGGGKIEGRVRLYKAFYVAHLYFWQENRGTLTGHPIVHMPFGPGIDDGDDLLFELQQQGAINIESRMRGPYREDVVKLAPGRRVSRALDDARVEAIRKAVKWVKGKTGAELSAETHLHSRSWNATVDGEEMDVYLDTLSEAEFRRVRRNVTEAAELVRAALEDGS